MLERIKNYGFKECISTKRYVVCHPYYMLLQKSGTKGHNPIQDKPPISAKEIKERKESYRKSPKPKSNGSFSDMARNWMYQIMLNERKSRCPP